MEDTGRLAITRSCIVALRQQVLCHPYAKTDGLSRTWWSQGRLSAEDEAMYCVLLQYRQDLRVLQPVGLRPDQEGSDVIRHPRVVGSERPGYRQRLELPRIIGVLHAALFSHQRSREKERSSNKANRTLGRGMTEITQSTRDETIGLPLNISNKTSL